MSHFRLEAPPPSTLLIFFSPTEFGTVHRIPFCRNSIDSFIFRYIWYVLSFFVSPFLPHPFLLASFPTRAKGRPTPLPHSRLFSKNLKKSICAFHRVWEKRVLNRAAPLFHSISTTHTLLDASQDGNFCMGKVWIASWEASSKV